MRRATDAQGKMDFTRIESDIDQGNPAVTVAEVTAELEGIDSSELSPLYESMAT